MDVTSVVTPSWRWSKERVTVAVILGAALLFKLVYLTFYAQQIPYYRFPMGDSAIYLEWANRILSGDFWGLQEPYKVFYRAPLYPYLLAFSLKIFGSSLLPIYLGQILLGVFNLYLTYLITRRLFSHQAGVAAMVIAALYAPLTFKESKLVSVTLVITCLLLAAWILIRTYCPADAKPSAGKPVSRWPWFWSGLLVGVATIAWGGTIVIVPLLAVFWFFFPKPRPRFSLVLWFALGWFLMILPVTLHNLLVGNDFVLVNSNSGYTFYQGNNPAAAGTITHPPEVYEKTYGGRFPTGIADQQAFDQGYASAQLYPPQQGREQQIAKPSEASAFWFKRGLNWIAKNPGRFLRLEFQKLLLMLSNWEFASNYYINVEWDLVPVLRLLFMPFALIFALGVLGIILAAARRKGTETNSCPPGAEWPLYLIIVATALTLLVFYVGTRYRLPLILPLTVFAGAAAERIITLWRRRKPALPELGLVVILVIVSAVLCGVPLTERYNFISVLGYRNLGECLTIFEQAPARAEKALDRALKIYEALPSPNTNPLAINALSEVHLLRGNARLNQEKYDSAIADFRRAIKTDPRMTDAYSRLAIAFQAKALSQAGTGGTPSGALLDTALSYARLYWNEDTLALPANSLMGDIQRARGERDSALRYYYAIVRMDSVRVPVLMVIGDLLAEKGDTAAALAMFHRASRADTLDPLVAIRLGSLYGIRGEHQRAVDIFATMLNRLEANPKLLEALRQSPVGGAYIDLKYYLGVAYLNLRNWERAAAIAQEVLRLVPEHKAAKELLANARNQTVPE